MRGTPIMPSSFSARQSTTGAKKKKSRDAPLETLATRTIHHSDARKMGYVTGATQSHSHARRIINLRVPPFRDAVSLPTPRPSPISKPRSATADKSVTKNTHAMHTPGSSPTVNDTVRERDLYISRQGTIKNTNGLPQKSQKT